MYFYHIYNIFKNKENGSINIHKQKKFLNENVSFLSAEQTVQPFLLFCTIAIRLSNFWEG